MPRNWRSSSVSCVLKPQSFRQPAENLPPNSRPVDLTHFVARNGVDILQMRLRHADQTGNAGEGFHHFILTDRLPRLYENVKLVLERLAGNADQANTIRAERVLQSLL